MKSIEWLAGLLEGEGYFSKMKSGSSGNYTTPVVAVTMTDADVIDSAKLIMVELGKRDITVAHKPLPSGKTGYSIYLTGLPAVKVMCAVLPYLGERRTCAVLSIISSWNPVKYREAREFKQSLSGVA